jgi:hypothetical protein
VDRIGAESVGMNLKEQSNPQITQIYADSPTVVDDSFHLQQAIRLGFAIVFLILVNPCNLRTNVFVE